MRCDVHRFPEPCILCRWAESGTFAERAEAARVAGLPAPNPSELPKGSNSQVTLTGSSPCPARFKLVPD